MSESQKIAVTGSSGMIGAALSGLLADQGHQVLPSAFSDPIPSECFFVCLIAFGAFYKTFVSD